VGGALGVAILVVILGAPTTAAAALRNFQHLWWYVAAMSALAGLVSTFLSPQKHTRAEVASDELVVQEATGLEEMLDSEIAVEARAFFDHQRAEPTEQH
jgi:uncharacterized membrane protein